MEKFKKLGRDEMKKVLGGDESVVPVLDGGGTCCAHTEGWESSRCDYPDAASAQQAASSAAVTYGVRTFYCCSCPPH